MSERSNYGTLEGPVGFFLFAVAQVVWAHKLPETGRWHSDRIHCFVIYRNQQLMIGDSVTSSSPTRKSVRVGKDLP